MKIKTISLACAFSALSLASCKRTPIQQINTPTKTLLSTVEAVKDDTTYFFLHKKIYHTKKISGKNVIDTISGYLKAEQNDLIIFFQNSKKLPKGAKQVGRKLKDGSVNYYF